MRRMPSPAAATAAAFVLAGCTSGGEPAAPPTPSETTATPSATTVTPIDDLDALDALGAAGFDPGVAWVEPGSSIAVLLPGSGTAECNPVPTGATAMDAATIAVSLDEPDTDGPCTEDLRQYGWVIEVAGDVDAAQTVSVTIGDGDDTTVLSLEPDAIVEVP